MTNRRSSWEKGSPSSPLFFDSSSNFYSPDISNYILQTISFREEELWVDFLVTNSPNRACSFLNGEPLLQKIPLQPRPLRTPLTMTLITPQFSSSTTPHPRPLKTLQEKILKQLRRILYPVPPSCFYKPKKNQELWSLFKNGTWLILKSKPGLLFQLKLPSNPFEMRKSISSEMIPKCILMQHLDYWLKMGVVARLT